VSCCAADGRIEVNGSAVTEGYLAPGAPPSTVEFDVLVPAGRLWVMGDHRSASTDSRSHLDPDGGADASTIPVRDVRGQVLAVLWPPREATLLR
jgi:signal peptidase I